MLLYDGEAYHPRERIRGGVVAHRAELWPETRAAADRLDALVRAGAPIASATDLFSSNVLRDVPADVRDARLRATFDHIGPAVADPGSLAVRVLEAPEASTLVWSIPTERGALECRVHLMGLSHPIVQAFEVTPRRSPPS
ncbi:hypothetical protein G3N30_02100 [Microbacterium lacticum]|uniref:hypothetical protein n=1 Tax=Microbacterium lacticum TaxID=33885 RepID=UPI0018B066B3|nr:hypothetical protein [Microbacterium lacticum]MBF9335067.1 hypothetical protein [Microbacterium lacticum]